MGITVFKLAGAAALAVALSACTMGSMFGGNEDAQLAGVTATPAQVAQGASSAIPAIATECPPIRVREGAGSYRVFAGNRTSDPQALRHQGVIDASRTLHVANGLITVRMGRWARHPRPAGQGTVTVPLRCRRTRRAPVFSHATTSPSRLASTPKFSHGRERGGAYVGGNHHHLGGV